MFITQSPRCIVNFCARTTYPPTDSPDAFVDMCRTLRVLNQIRDPSIGIPLTYTQFMQLSPEVLIQRLIYAHHHFLALRICQYLRMTPDKVLVHWACTKINLESPTDHTDEALADIILTKLSICPSISYAPIATAAHKAGRTILATLLLDAEPLASNQVPLLLKMGQDDAALRKAIESCDTDLVYLVLLHLLRVRPEVELFRTIKDHPLACNLFVLYAKQHNLEMLKSFYYHMQRPDEAASVVVLEAYRSESWAERISGLEIASEFYKQDKASAFAAQAVDNQLTLLPIQKDFEQEITEKFVDTSVSHSLALCFATGKKDEAVSLQRAFRVSDKRFWHVQVKTLTTCGKWRELEELVPGKRSTPPIGCVRVSLKVESVCVRFEARKVERGLLMLGVTGRRLFLLSFNCIATRRLRASQIHAVCGSVRRTRCKCRSGEIHSPFGGTSRENAMVLQHRVCEGQDDALRLSLV
jgi:hypothetical protein